jgi:hypothetical protein
LNLTSFEETSKYAIIKSLTGQGLKNVN